MKRSVVVATLAAIFTVPSACFAALLSEDFNDGSASSRWSVASQQEATRDPSTGPDGSVDFAFDYSSLGIANPSGGSDTIGAFIQVNKTDQVGDEGETYVIYPNGKSFSGSFILTADMFVYNDGNSGSTELGMAGAFLNNSAPIAPYQWGSEGGPLAWIYSGEGGSSADLAVFKEGTPDPNNDPFTAPNGTTGYNAIADYNSVAAGSIPGFQTGVASSKGPAESNPRGSWVKVRVESDGTTVSYYLNGALVDSYDNSGGFYTVGNIFLGATDPFNSANGGNGTIIDNVLVVPEPTVLVLSLVGFIGLFGARRRA